MSIDFEQQCVIYVKMFNSKNRFFILFFLLILHVFTYVNADEQIDENPLSILSTQLSGEAKANSRVKLEIEINLKEGFFAYAEKFQIKFTEPNDITSGELILDPIVEFSDEAGSKKVKKGLKNKSYISTFIEFPNSFSPQYKELKANLTYAACTKKYCLTPKEIPLLIPLPTTPAPVLTKNSDKDYSAIIKEKIETNLPFALILIFIFGFLSSLTPCIYPLIPITLAVIGSKSDKKTTKLKAFTLSVIYVHGIAFTYSLLGVFAAKTGGLFGASLSHPLVLVALAILFFLLSLSMFGFFEIKTPLWIQNKLHKKKSDDGFISVFISGIVAGVVASPCVGPVLVGILAYIAQTQNAFLGFILLFTFAMGLGVLLIIIGTFSSLVSKLPRSGGWLNIVKNSFAVMMFFVSVYYLYQALETRKSLDNNLQTEKHQSSLPWVKFSPELVEKAKQEGKPVMIDFYADWCAACVELEKHTFPNEKIKDISKSFILLKVDATEPFPELEDLQKQYKVFGLPTIVFISKTGEILFSSSLTGFEDADKLFNRMSTVLLK